MRAPSARRRDTARISAIVISAVSAVSTPGVLVTVMPRASAAGTSILSTPLPKLAISFRFGPASATTEASISSVTVGTSTSALLTASIRSAGCMGRSSRLRRASNNSRMRVSTTSGRRRVTTTSGLFFCGIANSLEHAALQRHRFIAQSMLDFEIEHVVRFRRCRRKAADRAPSASRHAPLHAVNPARREMDRAAFAGAFASLAEVGKDNSIGSRRLRSDPDFDRALRASRASFAATGATAAARDAARSRACRCRATSASSPTG